MILFSKTSFSPIRPQTQIEQVHSPISFPVDVIVSGNCDPCQTQRGDQIR